MKIRRTITAILWMVLVILGVIKVLWEFEFNLWLDAPPTDLDNLRLSDTILGIVCLVYLISKEEDSTDGR